MRKTPFFIFWGTASFLCLMVALFNYMVDPLWCFDHYWPFGRYQTAMNERQQKTNYLTFHYVSCDTLVLGSSRLLPLDPEDIPGQVFNYSFGAGLPVEFPAYARYAQERSSKPIERVILGLSFFETNLSEKRAFASPEMYIQESKSLFYRYRTLLSLRVLRYAFFNAKRTILDISDGAYIRTKEGISGRKARCPVKKDALLTAIRANIDQAQRSYGYDYKYNYRNVEYYKEIRGDFPKSHFYVFVTPVSHQLLTQIMAEGRWPDYVRWLNELVEVYGEVWNFMYMNEVSKNVSKHFRDAHHASRELLALIVNKMYGLPVESRYKDFGILMTKETIHKDLAFLKAHMVSGDLVE